MSKHSRLRSVRKQKQQNTRNMAIIIGVVMVLGMGLIVVGLVNGGSPEVAQERLDRDPVAGDPDAPVTLIEYGAYSCSACRQWHQLGVVEDILARYPGQVKFVFRDFPVITPAYDQMAAEIAQCALDQDQALFWELHDGFYTVITPGSSSNLILDYAAQIGLDRAALESCYKQGIHRRTVEYDRGRAFELGLRGTPGFTVNDQVVYNASPDVLTQYIEAALTLTN